MNRIDTLEPQFKTKVETLLQQLQEATGLKWAITSARRTMAEQQHLFDQGRIAPGKVVTNAKPGSSPHNFGLAVDLAPINPKTGDVWWDAPRSKWKAMADTAKGMGLVSGFYFKTIFDAPHVEDPNWRDVRVAWQQGKVQVA